MKIAAILAAAGTGQRLGAGKPKALVGVRGKSILRYSFEALSCAWPFAEFIVTAPPGQIQPIRRALGKISNAVRVVEGGATRAQSVFNALSVVGADVEWVLIHDAARPLVSKDTVRRTIIEAKKSGGAIAGLPVSSTVKRVTSDGAIEATVDRKKLFLAQTPQVFKKDLLLGRYHKLGKKAALATDDASLFDGTRIKVGVVTDSPRNFKITTPHDLELFKYSLQSKRG